MSIFTVLTYAMLTLVVVTGTVSLFGEMGIHWDRRWLKRRLLPTQARRLLRHRA